MRRGLSSSLFFILTLSFTSMAFNVVDSSHNTFNPALDFEIRLLNGNLTMLSNYTGKPIILDLFATWAAPCVAQHDVLKSIHTNYPKITIISVSVDQNENLEILIDFKEQNGLEWEIGQDITGNGARIFEATAIPTIAFLNRFGILTHWHQGVTSLDTLVDWITSEVDDTTTDSTSSSLNSTNTNEILSINTNDTAIPSLTPSFTLLNSLIMIGLLIVRFRRKKQKNKNL
ncbi:MAG: TlpA family protein disulfide reductase [Candidatus Hodarchaeales archaeon]|jgi:thiol-disulfide isomerase/thioredoxin